LKTNINHFITLLFVTVIAFSSEAQDIHFSQFYNSPSSLNPATTGNFRGDYRAAFIYRRQWQAVVDINDDGDDQYFASAVEREKIIETKPFTTFNLSIDLPFYLGDHKFGGGVKIYSDESGRIEVYNDEGKEEQRKLTTTKISASLSYIKKIKGHQISVGFQPSYTTKKADVPGKYKTADSDIIRNPDASWNMLSPTEGEAIGSGDVIKYYDINAGVMWSKDFGKFEPVVGLAMYHIINPKESVLGGTARLPNRNVVSFGGTYDLNSDFFLMPNLLFMTHKRVHDLVYGFNLGYNLDNVMLNGKIDFNYIYFGPQIRHSAINFDSMILTVGANLKKWNVGLSRDMTLSRLQTGTNSQNGTWEVSIIYIKPETLLKKKAIPCDRY
jgi:type IX secretion system PorP/SprF family membrane protein